MFAVIKTGGKQYKVAKDDIIAVEKIEAEVGDTVRFEDVLMVGDGEAAPKLGAPILDGASVEAEVVRQGRTRKILVFKKKRRHNYRRKNGHRQAQTFLRIGTISA